MKKLLIFGVILLVFGAVLYQNGTLWLVKLLGAGNAQNTSARATGKTVSYKDGTYDGNAVDAIYGNIQVRAVVSGGKISDVQFVQYPNDRPRSVAINTLAMPNLKQEAIQAQTAQVDIVSGATDSSQAFIQSLSSALSKAS